MGLVSAQWGQSPCEVRPFQWQARASARQVRTSLGLCPWLPVPQAAGLCCTAGVGSAPVPSATWFSALTAHLKYLLAQTGGLWNRLGSAPKTKEKNLKKVDPRVPGTEEDDSELQRAWGALIKEKEQSRQKKSRLDNLPSLQIEVSRESSSGSEAES